MYDSLTNSGNTKTFKKRIARLQRYIVGVFSSQKRFDDLIAIIEVEHISEK